jgi:hypothetical protein
MSITERAMLVQPTITLWSARRLDKRVTEEVAKQHYADKERAGRYNKLLIDPKAATFEAVRQAAQKARDYHYQHTLPWTQQGAQILPQAEFHEYSKTMAEMQSSFLDAARAFISDYPRLKEKARLELNGLYDEDDYPLEHELKRKFSFEVAFFPLPDERDWRVKLGTAEEERIRQRIRDELEHATKNATRDLWRRLYEAVERMVQRLSVPDGRFRDSLVENVRELCDLVPRLNVAQDPELEAMRARVEAELAGYHPETLRTNPDARSEATRRAAEIARKMAAYAGCAA